MQIPFHKPYITDKEIDEVVDSLKSGWHTMGPKTVRFEQDFNGYIGSDHSIAVNSGTAALHLALRAVNLKPGDEVIIPTMTFTATGEVVCYFNARPVIVDVEKDTHNMDITRIEEAITKNTKAIIPVHFAGQPCDMDEIMAIARKYNLHVIEDAAHALPAWFSKEQSKRLMVGTIGDLTCFSFYATKTLSTGEGGMVTTGNEEWAEKIRVLRLHGISHDAWKRHADQGSWYYEVVEPGYKYNMTDIQAGLGIAQLIKVEWMWEKRDRIAGKYTRAFLPHEEIIVPHIKPDRVSAWNLYVIKLNPETLKIDRNSFIEELKKSGISTGVHFIPLHRHPFYKKTFKLDTKGFPVAEWLYERIISLPIYPGMTDEQVNYVIGSVLNTTKKYKR
jgi:perosamine synthetase